MAAHAGPPPAGRRGRFAARAGGDVQLSDLLRESHIFGSVVREVLEVRLLNDVTRLPLSVSQFRLVKLMALDGHHQVRDIAAFLGVSPPAATKCIDKLERLGLVARSPSARDRRATWLAVSPRGRRVVRRYEALKAARMAPVLRRSPAVAIRDLTRLLHRFSVSLLDLERPTAGECLRCAAYIAEPCAVGDIIGRCPYQAARDARRAPLRRRATSPRHATEA